MTNYELTGYLDEKRVVWYEDIIHVDVRKTAQFEDLPREMYEVNFNNNGNFTYQYNPDTKTFYIDYQDDKRMEQQEKEHLAMIEWKTPEEQKEILKGKYVSYLQRCPFVILYGEEKKNVAEVVDGLISFVS